MDSSVARYSSNVVVAVAESESDGEGAVSVADAATRRRTARRVVDGVV
jgi:hypothetical protein